MLLFFWLRPTKDRHLDGFIRNPTIVCSTLSGSVALRDWCYADWSTEYHRDVVYVIGMCPGAPCTGVSDRGNCNAAGIANG